MEIEQTAKFLKIKATPQEPALLDEITKIDPSLPEAIGFETLMQDPVVTPPSPEPEAMVNLVLPLPTPVENEPRSNDHPLENTKISSEIARLEAPALTTPPPLATAHELPITSKDTSPPARPEIAPAVAPNPPVVTVSAAPALASAKPGITPEKPEAPKPAREDMPALKSAAPMAASAPQAPPAAVANLVAFFEPKTTKMPDAPVTVLPKEAAPLPANRVIAAPAAQNAAPAFAPLAQNPMPELTPASAEPDFALTVRTERLLLESGASLPAMSRAAAPLQAQLAAQFPTQIAANTQKVIELRLDPPELGRVVIHITTQDQSVSAQILADRPDTLDLMRRHADFFTSSLEKAGFSQSSLSFQQGNGQSRAQTEPQFEIGQPENHPAEPPAQPEPARLVEGRLDIRL